MLKHHRLFAARRSLQTTMGLVREDLEWAMEKDDELYPALYDEMASLLALQEQLESGSPREQFDAADKILEGVLG